MRPGDWRRHQLRRLSSRITKRHALVSCALLAPFALIDGARDLARLRMQTDMHFNVIRGESAVWFGVTNVGDCAACDALNFFGWNDRGAPHFTSHANVVLRDERFAGDAGIGVAREVRVEYGVANA